MDRSLGACVDPGFEWSGKTFRVCPAPEDGFFHQCSVCVERDGRHGSNCTNAEASMTSLRKGPTTKLCVFLFIFVLLDTRRVFLFQSSQQMRSLRTQEKCRCGLAVHVKHGTCLHIEVIGILLAHAVFSRKLCSLTCLRVGGCRVVLCLVVCC